MTRQAPGLYWVAPSSPAGLFRWFYLKRQIEKHWHLAIEWRRARPEDWPSKPMGGEFAHARHWGYGYVSEQGSKLLFVVPRGWEEPEWELAEFDRALKQWRRLGYFEPLSPNWTMPAYRQ